MLIIHYPALNTGELNNRITPSVLYTQCLKDTSLVIMNGLIYTQKTPIQRVIKNE